MRRQTLFAGYVYAADAAVRHRISCNFQHTPHPPDHHADIPDRVLPDKSQRLTRAFAVASNPVRPLNVERPIWRPTHLDALAFHHLIVTKKKSVLTAELSFAETLPEVDADRSSGWCEIRKHKIVANHDRRDHNNGRQ